MDTKSRPDPRADIPDEYRPADWLIKNPNRPPNTKVGNDRNPLYAGIGRTLTAWETLETLLAWEFQRLCGTDKISALRAWGSIASSKARVGAIMAAADVVLKDEELARHRRCMEDVNLAGGVRNLVAHGMVFWQADDDRWTSDDIRTPDPKPPFVLAPAYYNTNKMKDGSFYLFSLAEIDGITAEIEKLQSRVSALRTGEYHSRFRFTFRYDQIHYLLRYSRRRNCVVIGGQDRAHVVDQISPFILFG